MASNNLTTMVRDITYYFIKHYYDKELQTTGVRILGEDHLQSMINRLYTDKATDLKKYIRDTLKNNLGDRYSALAVENILLEMFNDPEYSKHRVFLEIMEYQKKL
jgi:hypothetical protein